MKFFNNSTFKMAISATIAIFIAQGFKLEFAVTAGVIAILSIQNTKREALIIGARRIISATIAVILSYLLYVLLGNNPLVFSVVLLIFIPIAKKLKIEEDKDEFQFMSSALNNFNQGIKSRK